jgi:hypothetical protein
MANPATNLNGNGIQRVPTLDDLARYPDRAESLSDRTLAALASRALLVLAVINEARTSTAEDAQTVHQAEDRMLDADEAAALLHKPRRWLFEHKRTLPFVTIVSRKALLCSEAGLKKWLATRRV